VGTPSSNLIRTRSESRVKKTGFKGKEPDQESSSRFSLFAVETKTGIKIEIHVFGEKESLEPRG
jgi:hypothetical protein